MHRKHFPSDHSPFKIVLISFFTLLLMTSAGLSETGSSESNLLSKPVVSLYDEMHLNDSGLSKQAFESALSGYEKLGEKIKNPVLAIVDFTRSSKEKRLYIIDLEGKKLLHQTHVAHGRNSGDEFATAFSDLPESYQSSLGFYITGNTYQGKHGLSLRLNGCEEGINGNALKRAIVIHGADYVSEDFIAQHGRLGRSFGCPAVSVKDAQPVISTLKEGSCLYIHFPDPGYSTMSALCPAQP